MEPMATEQRAAIENRLRNLFWTVSGNYDADIRPYVERYCASPKLALYDAIKQGALEKYLDAEQLAVYIVKKCALGAEEAVLTELTQLCVDVAVYPLIRAERSGIEQIRQEAFVLLLEDCPSTPLEQLRQWVIRRFLGFPTPASSAIQAQAEQVEQLAGQRDTGRLIAVIDTLYNTILDSDFVQRGGSLQDVMAVTAEELLQYRPEQSMTDANIQKVMEAYRAKVKDALRNAAASPSSPWLPSLRKSGEPVEHSEPNAAAAEKFYAYIERQFGKSYLSRLEQEQYSRRLCTGLHQQCFLYFTDGVLSNPAVKNTQFLRTRMQELKNETYLDMNRHTVQRSISVLSAMLRQAQILQREEDTVRAEYGRICPTQLWKVGRSHDAKLFDCRKKRQCSSFVIDILLDGSSSQMRRQPQIAAQAYIISQAFSNAGIPHRVSSFCTHRECTIVHRFRNFDDAEDSNRNILQFRAFGENRDGLAIRAIMDGLQHRAEEKKLLILLSDGRPNTLGLLHPGGGAPVPYVGEVAVQDTALEIRKARNQGISVLGIFIGAEDDLAVERRIFGKEFVYTRQIDSFAHIVGTYLRKQMEQEE